MPAQSPSASLISSPPVIPSLFTGVAASPTITQTPAIVMPPGLRPPPGNGRLTLGLPGGVPRLGTPTRQHIQYRRPTTYQPGYAGYYGYKNSRRYQRHNPVSYGNSRYPYASTNTFQRRYRQTENERRINRGKVNDNKKVWQLIVPLSVGRKIGLVWSRHGYFGAESASRQNANHGSINNAWEATELYRKGTDLSLGVRCF